jgi:hypothetical protein
MMQRTKGTTLDEIMKATDWQRHTVRGFVSILGSKGVHKIESSKNAAGEHTYRIAKQPTNPTFLSNAASGLAWAGVLACVVHNTLQNIGSLKCFGSGDG